MLTLPGQSPNTPIGLSGENMKLRITWWIDNQLISDKILTDKGLEFLVKVLSTAETIQSWTILIGSDPTPEDPSDDIIYDQKLSYSPTITTEVGSDYSRIRFDVNASSTDLSGITVGELGLQVTTSDGTNTYTYLVDRTSYTPTQFTTSKNFTCIIEFRRW